MPSRNDSAMVKAFETVLAQLKERGYTPTLNIMDNEYSKAVEAYIRKQKINIQLVAPHNHRVNALLCLYSFQVFTRNCTYWELVATCRVFI